MHKQEYLDGWSTHAEFYSDVERMTWPLAVELAEWVDSTVPLNSAGASAFDNGCGGGILSKAIKKVNPQIPLLSTDISEGMVQQTKNRAEFEGWLNHQAKVLDARTLTGILDTSITHCMSQFMISLAPEPDRIAQEMHRVLRSDGLLGLGTWGATAYTCWTDPWTIAARETIPDYHCPPLMPARWCEADLVRAALEEVGFKQVEVREKNVLWEWESVEAIMHYVFEASNPGVEFFKQDFVAKGGDLVDIRPRYEMALRRLYEKDHGQGPMLVPVRAVLVIARK